MFRAICDPHGASSATSPRSPLSPADGLSWRGPAGISKGRPQVVQKRPPRVYEERQGAERYRSGWAMLLHSAAAQTRWRDPLTVSFPSRMSRVRIPSPAPLSSGPPSSRERPNPLRRPVPSTGGRRRSGRRRRRRPGRAPSPSIMSSRRSAATRPISTPDWLTVVSGGIVNAAMSMSSKPTIDSRSGTTTFAWNAAWSSPIAIVSEAAKTAVGWPGRSRWANSSRPEVVARLRVRLRREVDPGPVADAVLLHEPLVDARAERTVRHPLVGDADDPPMAELPEVLEGEERAPLVVDVDARARGRGPTRSLTPTTCSWRSARSSSVASPPSMSPRTRIPSACDCSNIDP